MAKPRKRKASQAGKATERRWWRLGLLALGLLLVAGSVGTWVSVLLTDPARLPLKTIRITGELSHVDRVLLQQRVVAAIDGGFFSVDMRKLREAAKQLAWVDKVSIRRVWPQTLIMDVTEQMPVARWGSKALVNGRGEVFQPESGALPGKLPRFSGEAEDAPAAVALFRLASARLAGVGLKVRRLAAQGRRDWRLELDNGLTLLLARSEATRSLERFVTALPVITDQPGRRMERVDMRYANGFAVRWAPLDEANDKKKPRGAA
jgi:cell division protein FtsQ